MDCNWGVVAMQKKGLSIACAALGVAGVVALAGFGRGPAAVAAPAKAEPAPSPSPVAQGKYGTIKGRLVWGGKELPKAEVLVAKGDKNAKDPQVCAREELRSRELVVDPKTKGIRFGFAYLVRPKGTNPEAVKALAGKTEAVEIDQKNCEFIPYAVAVHKGQKLVFKSSDPINHNVDLKGFNNPLNQNVAPSGQLPIPKLNAERLPMKVVCDIHGWMKCWVGIFDHPFFAITKEDGSFEIQGVPAGAQKLIVWQERTGFVTSGKSSGQTVNVEAGKTVDVGEIVLDPANVK
jgi:hypothetical protein